MAVQLMDVHVHPFIMNSRHDPNDDSIKTKNLF